MAEREAAPAIRLDELAVFSGIGAQALEQLTRRALRRRLGKGELLFNVGDKSDALYIVVDGRIRIWTVSAAGAEVTLNVLSRAAVFGEIGMLDDRPRTAGASAMAPTELLSVPRNLFFDTLERDPSLVRNVIRLLCERIRWTSARMEDATLRQGPQRLARILTHLAEEHGRKTPRGVEIQIKLTQGELAQWTAMSRESLNKLLNRWIDDGVVVQERGVLTIRNVERLDDLGEGD
jgi:CRP-like cAMP-binding protein